MEIEAAVLRLSELRISLHEIQMQLLNLKCNFDLMSVQIVSLQQTFLRISILIRVISPEQIALHHAGAVDESKPAVECDPRLEGETG